MPLSKFEKFGGNWGAAFQTWKVWENYILVKKKKYDNGHPSAKGGVGRKNFFKWDNWIYAFSVFDQCGGISVLFFGGHFLSEVF